MPSSSRRAQRAAGTPRSAKVGDTVGGLSWIEWSGDARTLDQRDQRSAGWCRTSGIDPLLGWLSQATARHGPSAAADVGSRSEEHTSELPSLMRISSAVFCLHNKIK